MKHAVPALLLLPLLATPLPADKDDDVKSVQRTGDGSQVCGLGKAFHAGRRKELMKRLEEGFVVIRGLPAPRGNVEFTQDKVFWYLTGIESPDAALVLDVKRKREILFLPKADHGWETWNGELWDVEDDFVKKLSGFKDVRPSEDLVDELDDILKKRAVAWVHLQPHTALSGSYDSASKFVGARKRDPLDGRLTREETLKNHLEERFGVEVRDCTDVVNEMRRVKTPEEVDAMRRAARAGAVALAEAMRATAPGVGEWELDALMSHVHIREGAHGPAYAAIVGSGANSCVLHYLDASRRMKKGEILLIDYGPEVDHYVTDITRTWPVGGRYSKRMKELYAAVLEAQKAGIAAVAPGKTLAEVNAACDKVLRDKGMMGMRSHGACHYIGMEVHDPGDVFAPMEPGVAFTVEPGLYDRKLGIGVRIEDVVVCTEDGAEVISAGVPKELDEVEALIKERGILELLQEHGE